MDATGCDQRVPGLGWFGWNAAGLGTWRWQDGEPDLWPIRLLQDSTANSVKGLARLGNASEIQATGGTSDCEEELIPLDEFASRAGCRRTEEPERRDE